MKWAKQLLEVTDMPVSQISDELGFNEPGYFIKIFKNSKRSHLLFIVKVIGKKQDQLEHLDGRSANGPLFQSLPNPDFNDLPNIN